MKSGMIPSENPVELSALIAGHLARSDFEKIPGTAVTAAKRAILDGLGVMLAASGCSDDIQPFVELARAYRGLPQASIFGFADRVGLPMAALANGAMARWRTRLISKMPLIRYRHTPMHRCCRRSLR